MKRLQLLDVVKLTTDIPDDGLQQGNVGTIVEIFEYPDLAYEVEFTDECGRTTAQVALLPHQIELVPRRASENAERLKPVPAH
ncbi:MAG: DUF4926 domain-containing protein [Chloroflexota bacterium]